MQCVRTEGMSTVCIILNNKRMITVMSPSPATSFGRNPIKDWQDELRSILYFCLFLPKLFISLCAKCQWECAPATKKSRLSLLGKEPAAPRFNFVSKEEIRKALVPDNTQRSTSWALEVFSAWVKTREESGILPSWFTGTGGSWQSVQVACSLCNWRT